MRVRWSDPLAKPWPTWGSKPPPPVRRPVEKLYPVRWWRRRRRSDPLDVSTLRTGAMPPDWFDFEEE